MWRSTRSLWEWTCSHPTVAGGTEAATANGTYCVSESQQDGMKGGHKAGPGQVQRKTTSRQNPTHISNINECNQPINKIKDKSISMTMTTDTVSDPVRKFRPVLSATRQAVMQNVTDAGLVPGRKQNTMGLETGSR